MKTNSKNVLYAFIASCALNSPSSTMAQCTSPGAIDPVFAPTTLASSPLLLVRTRTLENQVTSNGSRVIASFNYGPGVPANNNFLLRRFSSTPQITDFEDPSDLAFRANIMSGTCNSGRTYNLINGLTKDIYDIANGSNGEIFICGNFTYSMSNISANSLTCAPSGAYFGNFGPVSTRAYRPGGVSKFDSNGILIDTFQVDWDSPLVVWPGAPLVCPNNFIGSSATPHVYGLAFDQTRNELYLVANKRGSTTQQCVLRVDANTGDVISSFPINTDANLNGSRVVLEFDNPNNPQRLFVVHPNLLYNSNDTDPNETQNNFKSDLLLLNISQPQMEEINTNWIRAGAGTDLFLTVNNSGSLNDILIDPNNSGIIYLACNAGTQLQYGGAASTVGNVTSLNVSYIGNTAIFSDNTNFTDLLFTGNCQDIAMDLCNRIIATQFHANGIYTINTLHRIASDGSLDGTFVNTDEVGKIYDLLISPQNQIWLGQDSRANSLGLFVDNNAISVVCNSNSSSGFDYCKSYANGIYSIQIPILTPSDPNVTWTINAIDAGGNPVVFNPAPPTTDLLFQNWLNTTDFNISWQVQVTKNVNSCGATCTHLEQWNPILPCAGAPGTFTNAQLRNETINNPINLNSRPSFTTINVYPNPSSGIFRISGDFDVKVPVEIRAFDLKGIEVKNKVIPTFSLNGEDVDLSGLPSGTYFLKITQNHTTIDSKIVVD